MSKAWVSEYINVKLVMNPNGQAAQCPEGPPLATQVVDFTSGAAATTNPFNNKTRFLRIVADAKCHRVFGSAPVATTSNEYVPADSTEFLGLPPDHGTASGQTAYKLGFIANS